MDPAKTFVAVENISHDQWEESVDIDRLEDTLRRFEDVAPEILSVTDHSYLDTLMGCTSKVWDRWTSCPPCLPDIGYSGASDVWHARVSEKMNPQRKSGRSRDHIITIGPGFMSASSAKRSPADTIKSLMGLRCV